MKRIKLFLCVVSGVLFSCAPTTVENKDQNLSELIPAEVPKMGFKSLADSLTGVKFKNSLKEDDKINYFTYSYMYMGGGVAIGDINNDGLPDLYFTGNRVENKLYLNKGNMEFEDISHKAGVQGDNRWYAGVSMADVNNDGFLDIYLSVAGNFTTTQNQLMINNGDLTFTESAAKYGLNDKGYSVQSNFFDYDRDGDLDMYLANYPPTSFDSPVEYYHKKNLNPADNETDRFYRNDGPSGFVDVTDQVGVRNFGLSLSASVSDFNNDGFLDVYVSNDFESPDYLYINQGDGTFKDQVKKYTQHTALYGMGSDAADINNDGLMDLMQLDMMAEDNKQQKTNMPSMNPEKFYSTVELGLHYQFMRNCLQLNNGNETFSDVAEIAGVNATDWSWAVLLIDMDNDGWKDIFISNGIRRNVNDKDYTHDIAKKNRDGLIKDEDLLDLVREMPVVTIKNYTYKNLGDLTFEKKVDEWGISYKGFTNGTAYGDLDGDGDLDLVLNNLDNKSMVYENNASSLKNGNFLSVQLKGKEDNINGIGAKVYVRSGDLEQWQEMLTSRGFQSSVEPVLHFGLGSNNKVEELKVIWPNGNVQKVKDIKAGQKLVIQQNATAPTIEEKKPTLFIEQDDKFGINYRHIENEFDDFEREVLLPHKMSQFGPGLAIGDINGDKLEDFFVGGASGKVGALYTQNSSGKFEKKSFPDAKKDALSEDIDALFFDFENDGDLDLYVVSGGNEYKQDAPQLQDRIYINDGKGNLKKVAGMLPKMIASGGCVKAHDFDKDGDLDLFVGGRQVPGKYPFPGQSYLLENKGDKFEDITASMAPELSKIGMVTSALWTDFNNDGASDLIVTGEWMPLQFFEKTKSGFVDKTKEYGFENTTGWWFSLEMADMDNDGDQDYIAGNLGLNYKYKGTEKEPFHVYADDFDENGSSDIVLGYYNDGKAYPVRGLQCSSQQMPIIKKKFKTYTSFGNATLDKVYGSDKLEKALHYEAKLFASVYIENVGDGKFEIKPLPNMAQISSINSLVVHDFDADGNKDILIAGNMHGSEVETPRNDAGVGLWLKGDGKGNYEVVPTLKSGFYTANVVNDMKLIDHAGKKVLLIGNNNTMMQTYTFGH